MNETSVDLTAGDRRVPGSQRPKVATALGTLDAAAIADVDRSGFVVLRGRRWGLDWAVGAEDRWHHPADEVAVRQSPLRATPVVETAMRVPGGDVVHRVYGARGHSSGWDDSCVVIEVENLSSVAVALAFILRPRQLDGPGALGGIEIDGSVIRLDGHVAAVLSRPPLRAAVGGPGQPAQLLAAGQDVAADGLHERRADEDLEAAVVVPLPHTASVRIVLPRPETSKRRFFGRPRASTPGSDIDVPGPGEVIDGWHTLTGHAARVVLPEPVLDDTVSGAQRSVSLNFGDGFLDPPISPPDSAARAEAIVTLLARSGLGDPLAPIARALVAQQRLNGSVRMADSSEGATALLIAAAPLLAEGDEFIVEDLLGPVAKAIHHLRRDTAALAPTTPVALVRIAPALGAIGQPEVAEDALTAARELRGRALETVRSGDRAGSLVQRAQALSTAIRGRDPEPRRTVLKDLTAAARLGTVVARAADYDAQGNPAGSPACDPAASAALANTVLDMALEETAEGLSMWPLWPQRWFGAPAEVHGIRTALGIVSHAVRWHGDRPALLWQIEPIDGIDPDAIVPSLRAPGLDPDWRAEGWSGEALLGPVAPPVGIPGAEGAPQPDPTTAEDEANAHGRAPEEGESFS